VSNKKKILILNTGGTFNKIYREIDGDLIVSQNNDFINDILSYSKIKNCIVEGLLYKDSLEINKKDREILRDYILHSPYKKILLIHGTDTMDKTAKYLSKYIKTKIVILTGSMIPYSINTVEATANFTLALGSLLEKKKNNIYIAMHGNVKRYKNIKKNRELGIFECQK